MQNHRKQLYIAVTFIVFITALVFSSINTGHSAPMADRDVRVINTTTEPVPTVAQGTTAIAGNVNITSMPTVKAQQFGSWNVDITNTPSVQVGNTATNPVQVRDVDSPARQPFQKGIAVTIPAGTGFESAFFQVPAGKRLVIEYVSNDGSSSPLQMRIATVVASEEVVHRFVTTRLENGIYSPIFVMSQQTRLYADPGTYVTVVLMTPGNQSASLFGVAISGYLVDVP